jgi:response regulator RpfG family c-di-GMP phosphodiesterase
MARAYIECNTGGHFDPGVVQAFLAQQPRIMEIAKKWQD